MPSTSTFKLLTPMGRTTDTEPLTFRTAGWMRPREEHIKTRSQNRRLEASTEPVTFSKDRPSTNGVPQPQLQPVQPSAKGSRRSTPMGPLATIALASESFQKLLKKSEEPFSKGEPHLHKADEFGVRSGTYTSGSDVRGFIRVYEYDHQGATYMIDADDSFVHFTAIWKALGKHKRERDVTRKSNCMLTPTGFVSHSRAWKVISRLSAVRALCQKDPWRLPQDSRQLGAIR